MATEGRYMRGALVEFTQSFLLPVPNVVLFQYNPETITHTWTQPEADAAQSDANPLAVKGAPGESFSLTIAMDAGDTIAEGNPVASGIAELSGVYSRLAALEMLLYPVDAGGGLLGTVSASVSVSVGGGGGGFSLGGAAGAQAGTSVPLSVVPTVLFVWGPGRILPVRVTTLTITEKLYDSLLNPTHAEAQLGLRVLTPKDLGVLRGPQALIARTAYDYTLKLRQTLATANLANAADAIIGMLPM